MQDTTIGSLIYSIEATDADIGSNGDIRFRILAPVSNQLHITLAFISVYTCHRVMEH